MILKNSYIISNIIYSIIKKIDHEKRIFQALKSANTPNKKDLSDVKEDINDGDIDLILDDYDRFRIVKYPSLESRFLNITYLKSGDETDKKDNFDETEDDDKYELTKVE